MIKNIRFIIRKPFTDEIRDRKYLHLQVLGEAPNIVFPMRLRNTEDDALQIELGKAELKLDLMKQVLNAEWEIES